MGQAAWEETNRRSGTGTRSEGRDFIARLVVDRNRKIRLHLDLWIPEYEAPSYEAVVTVGRAFAAAPSQVQCAYALTPGRQRWTRIPLAKEEPTMRYLWLLLCLGMAVVLAGCTDPLIPSLHPLYRAAGDVTFDPTLVGSWQLVDLLTGEPHPDAENPSTFVFAKGAAARVYYLTVTHKGPATREDLIGHWEARLVKVGAHEFLDVTPRLSELDASGDFASGFIVRLHVFLLVSKTSDHLTLSLLRPEWWEEQLSGATPPQQTTEIDGTSLLTTPTKDLRTILSTADFDQLRRLPDFSLKRTPDPSP